MLIFYNVLTSISIPFLKLFGLFHRKIRAGNAGRSKTFAILKKQLHQDKKTLWFHCASLGEYEQGLPVFEKLIASNNQYNVVLSFFSPSGYTIKKNTSWATAVVYLPVDTPQNAKKFVALINPELCIFVKYDIWPNYLKALRAQNIPAFLISANFRKNQIYFKWYGKFLLHAIQSFEHIFVQHDTSKTLLAQKDINQVTTSGDTRFDRVANQLNMDNTLTFIEDFIDEHLCFVAGSTWPEDENLLIPFINETHSSKVKFIIAPHEIHQSHISSICQSLEVPFVRYSAMKDKHLKDAKVFILDTIGLLSKVYAYADLAMVGGASGTTGLHNTLEPAVFGIPIGIGKNYQKFPEAKAMIALGGMFSFSNQKELTSHYQELISNETKRSKMGRSNAVYIKKNTGAVVQILDLLRTYVGVDKIDA